MVMLPRIASSLPSNKALMGPGFEYVRWRLKMDGLLVSVSAGLGYTALLLFVGTQGVRHVRVRTELELAEQLQQTLAPPLADSNAGYEIQGRSMPSSQMGGDLLDAVNDGDALTCYAPTSPATGFRRASSWAWSRAARGQLCSGPDHWKGCWRI